MSFTSTTFFVFLLSFLVVYWLARGKVIQNILLLVGSLIFYGWIHPWYSIMLAASTLVDYGIARSLARPGANKTALISASLALNLGLWGFFKFFDFFSPQLAALLTNAGIDLDPRWVPLVVPVGLSFYMLRKLAYIFDISRGVLIPEKNLVDFGVYVSFFPQVVAGPIERPKMLLSQIQMVRTWKGQYFYNAWPLLLMGFFKKIVIADSVGVIVDRLFMLQQPTKLLLLVATLGFALQLLADFSAYTDISRGIAWLLGVETSENFRLPYLSWSPAEFWNRWHITLSNWLRDYLFYPLRRFLLSKPKLPTSLAWLIPPMLTMLASGFWHGTGWTYVAWGVFHGLLIVIYQRLDRSRFRMARRGVKVWLAWGVMFIWVLFGWMLFRAPSLSWLMDVLLHAPLVGARQEILVGLISLSTVLFYALPLFVKMVLDRHSKPHSIAQFVYYALATLAILIYLNPAPPDFIYFQF